MLGAMCDATVNQLSSAEVRRKLHFQRNCRHNVSNNAQTVWAVCRNLTQG